MRRISISVGRIVLIIIIIIAIYIAFESLMTLFTYVQNNTVTSTSNDANQEIEMEKATPQKSPISFNEMQEIKQKFPRIHYRGEIYYTVYGKEVMENDEILDLSNAEIDENLIETIKLLPNVKEVNLYNQNLTEDEKVALRETFPYITFKWPVNVLNESFDCNIEELNLSNKKIDDIEGLKKSLKLFTNLKKVDLSNTNLSNEELDNLRKLFPNIRIDWVVHLGRWSLRTDAVAFSVLITHFDYKRMTSEDIQVLKYCTELQALDVGHQAIEDISVIGEYLPNLRVLILADNKIKDISSLSNLKHLHYLELFMNDITDVTPLASCTELVDLNICYNYHFSNVDGILNLPKLERLWLINDAISSESYKMISEKYPNVKIVTTGSGSTNSGWRTHERYYTMIDMYKNNYISDVFLKYDGTD